MAKKISTEELDQLTGIVDNDAKSYTFEADVSVNGEKKHGAFTVKYMGVAARLRLGTIRAKLLDGAPQQSVDVLTDDIAYMMAYLQVALTKAPAWWNYEEIDDVDDLRGVYMEAYNFMQLFRQANDSSANAGHSTAATSQTAVANK